MTEKNVSRAAGLLGLVCAGLAASADVVTNDYFGDITSPTTLRGVTNIIAKCAPVNISADLTLDDRTFLRLRGESANSPAWVNLAPTANPVTLTVQGNSGFFTAYRNSMDGANANNEWGKTGIDDPRGSGKETEPTYYRVRMGVVDGAPGSTGPARIVLKTNPKFGYNAFSGFWARFLDIETSVAPDPETGMIDFLEIPASVVADISQIQNKSTLYPARILFRGGTLLRNNATANGAPLSPVSGATLVLEGVDGADIRLKSQFQQARFTGRKGGTVRIVGRHVYLAQSGYYPQGAPGANHNSWDLDKDDHVVWEHTGNLLFVENVWLRTTSDDLLPHGPATGILSLGYNTGIKEAAAASGEAIPYCCLDLWGTRQYVNGVTSTGAEAWRRGVVTNTHATATGTLVLGADGVDGTLNAKCTARVAVEKVGAGRLTVRAATGEALDVQAGSVNFSEACAFTNVTAAVGTTLDGAVTVAGAFTATGATPPRALGLNLALAAGATVSVAAATPLVVYTLTVGGAAVPSGTYTAADWLAAGTVTVLWRAGDAVTDVAWTGAGATDAAAEAANWARPVDFSLLGARPVFATGGARAELAGASSFSGMAFDAPGDFTLAAADGSAGTVNLFGNLDLAAAPAGERRTYAVTAPLELVTGQTLTLPTNVTLKLTGGLAGSAAGGLEMVGTKLSDLVYDYDDAGGALVLENARISGPISHTRGGGWLVLRGDVGCPGDTSPLTFNYCRLRDNKTMPSGFADVARFALTGNTRLEGATIHKPVTVEGRGQIGLGCDRWLVGATNTVNTFKALVSCGPSTAFRADTGCTYVFEKGITVESGGLGLLPTDDGSTQTRYEVRGPVVVKSTNRTFNFGSTTRVEFWSAGCSVRHFVEPSAATLAFQVDDVFTDTGFLFTSDRGGTLELGATHQRMKWLCSGKNVEFVATGGMLRGTVRGDWPATLEVTSGVPDGHEAVTNCGAQITGWVTLAKSGAGVHRMLARAYESFGNVAVSGGRLEFDAGATWLNGTNVTVRGTGTLKVGSAGTFRDDVRIRAEGADWKLDLTGLQKAESFVVDGVPMPGGDYGAGHAKLGAHFTGPGILRVRQVGIFLILR